MNKATSIATLALGVLMIVSGIVKIVSALG